MFICCLSYNASVTFVFVALVAIMNLRSSKMFSAPKHVGELYKILKHFNRHLSADRFGTALSYATYCHI